MGAPSDEYTSIVDVVDVVGFSQDCNQDRWLFRYEELKTFKSTHGHCRVPHIFRDNPGLGHWVHTQRTHYKWNKEGKPSSMTNIRAQELEDIGFEWQIYDEDWMLRYEALKNFKFTYGHCRVPRGFRDNPALGRWVDTQRRAYKCMKEGKPTHMTDTRLQLLEDIDFEWQIHKGWMRRYEDLKSYKSIYGHCRVPQGFRDNPALGGWVHDQRKNYKFMKEGKPSHMTNERAQSLEDIGFEWHVTSRSRIKTNHVTSDTA